MISSACFSYLLYKITSSDRVILMNDFLVHARTADTVKKQTIFNNYNDDGGNDFKYDITLLALLQ